MENNHTAKIYLTKTAFEKHYVKVCGIPFSASLDESLKASNQIVLVDDLFAIDDELITGIAKELNALDSKFYTCHCTGTKAYQIMENEMNGKLVYLSAGMVVEFKF